MNENFNVIAAKAFLKDAVNMIGKDSESPIRHVFSARLPMMFPPGSDGNLPWWVEYHSKGSETYVQTNKNGKTKRGFIDTLVGSTVIEYEKNLTDVNLASHGEEQVREYCAGLINNGIPLENIIGILSDTVRWRAYFIDSLKPLPEVPGAQSYGESHLILEEIESLDLSAAGIQEANELGRFLVRHLGRHGGRILSSETLATDLGLDSSFCAHHIDGIRSVVDSAFTSNPTYASLIEKVWADFVSYFDDSDASGAFDRDTYIAELYILTLAKLLCANVLEGNGIVSDDSQLESILNGNFFQLKGFSNLVEYDYFGWLNEKKHVQQLLPVARSIQEDLAAYDFSQPPVEDLFGAVMAQLARRSQRLLLGQEWTPTWLSHVIVENLLDRLPQDDDPRFVDMCCGSGSLIVETVKQTRVRMESCGTSPNADSLRRLSQAITGFDIDPLAVLLAKVSWILAAREWINEAGAFDIIIPVYHADSLFASTPVAKKAAKNGAETLELELDGETITLPSFLISPDAISLFDLILGTTYSVAMTAAEEPSTPDWTGVPESIVSEACVKTGINLQSVKKSAAESFVIKLLTTLESLQRSGRNGIWAFLLSNSYRPGLVSGSFNGLVSNPPWLAMSKIADNPYKETLVEKAELHGIKPPGASHLHAELATIFLLNAITRYLLPGAIIGCILPESVMSAHHHNPFRQAKYTSAPEPVHFSPDELWLIEGGTFKNEAIVMFGKKKLPHGTNNLSGKKSSPTSLTPVQIYIGSQGNRVAWSDTAFPSSVTGFYDPAKFRQGADIFPRTAIFHRVSANGRRFDLSRIQKPNDSLAYLINGAKKHKDFFIQAKGIDGKFLFDVLLSNHLTPFRIEAPATGFLPIEHTPSRWQPSSGMTIAASGPSTKNAFQKMFTIIGGKSQEVFDAIDTPRKKLTNQIFPNEGWLVVMGAGGKIVCAACENVATYDSKKLIIDQTLYWVVVPTQDEALYLTGLLNSDAINLVIAQFQPRGQFGERHVHKLPLGATPPFNPLDAAHVDVVLKTKDLLLDICNDQTANPSEFTNLLNLNKRLSNRRSALRQRLKDLPSYDAYENACRSLYAV